MPTVVLLVWSGLRRDGGSVLLGLGWCALFSLPPLITMEADWFALAPRYLYTTAAGVALVWATAAGHWLDTLTSITNARTTASNRPGRTLLYRATAAVLLGVVMLAPAMQHVQEGVRLYRMAGQAIWDVVTAAERARPILVVNLPLRITPHRRRYPLGFEGITPLPARVTADGIVYTHTGRPDAAEALAFGLVAPAAPETYTYRLFGHPAGWEELADAAQMARTVYVTRYEEERIYLVEAGGIAANASRSTLTRFGEHVELLAVDATCEAGRVALTTHWRVEAPLTADPTVFAHLLDAQDTLVAQADGYPLRGLLPFWLWEPGDAVRDVRDLGPASSGSYTIRLGVWEPSTGQRWPIAGREDDVVSVTVHCP